MATRRQQPHSNDQVQAEVTSEPLDATEADWARFEKVRTFKARTLAAYALGLNPRPGVRSRLRGAAHRQTRHDYETLLLFVDAEVRSRGSNQSIACVESDENFARHPRDRLIPAAKFVEAARYRFVLPEQMLKAAGWQDTNVVPNSKTAHEQGSATRRGASMAKVLLGILLSRYAMTIDFEQSDLAKRFQLKDGSWTDLQEAVDMAGVQSKRPSTGARPSISTTAIRNAVAEAIDILGEGEVRRGIGESLAKVRS